MDLLPKKDEQKQLYMFLLNARLLNYIIWIYSEVSTFNFTTSNCEDIDTVNNVLGGVNLQIGLRNCEHRSK